jgi:hypothetical protein
MYAGGMVGESKSDILKLIPKDWVPEWVLIDNTLTESEALGLVETATLSWPLIAKPDEGERGNGVALLSSEEQWRLYHTTARSPYILQAYCTLPVELGVFYIRHPNESKGRVTSVVRKAFLTMKGDGRTSIGEWCMKDPRARLVYDTLQKQWLAEWHLIPEYGEVKVLEPIGNHCRGTAFLDYTSAYSALLQPVMDAVARQIPGFYFGRFDLRCADPQGNTLSSHNVAILELNGCSAEPAHIYQAGYPFLRGQKVLLWHVDQLFKIATHNHSQGVAYLRTGTFIRNWRRHRRQQTQWKRK